VAGLGEGRDDSVEVSVELDDDSDPPLWPPVPKQPFSSRYRIRLAVAWLFDGQQDLPQ